ncbi:MAG: sulfotransferase [Sphingomonadales bacterium]|nr:sulfotransferase [Sphingomonadales bacterium]
MSRDQVIAAAQERTGLTDFGDSAILDGLDRLLDGYAHEAGFTERGYASAIETLVAALANRMRVEDWLSHHPELLARPIEKPLFLFGLPRTGTTLAINLLASDPARRAFLRWEAFDSVPPPRPEELHAGPRYQKAQDFVEMSLKYAPQISQIHHEEGDSPTECQFSMAPSFCAQVYESMADIPSYRHWFLYEADYRPAFRYHKRLLQLLQAEAGGRWTLKNPWHPLFLDVLCETYPDAQLVMTHRDPAEVVGSACNLIRVVREMASEKVDCAGIGASMVEIFQLMIARADAFKAKHGADAIHDVQYADVMRDPIAAVRGIYARFDEPFGAEAEAAMTRYMANNPQGKHGRHSYRLEDYGLTREAVHRDFAEYIERYRIPVKHSA